MPCGAITATATGTSALPARRMEEITEPVLAESKGCHAAKSVVYYIWRIIAKEQAENCTGPRCLLKWVEVQYGCRIE